MRALFLLLPCLVLAACSGRLFAPLPARDAAEPPLPPRFSDAGTQPLEDRWWQAFDDPVLNGLVETALADNLTLLAAEERVERAVALARRAGAALRPTLDASAGAGGVLTRREIAGETFDDSAESLSLGARASYEVDLWGRNRAARDAEVYDACATYFDLQAARITIAASVATTWYRLVEEGRIRVLLKEQIETNETLLSLIQSRFASGQAGAADVLRQQQLVERTRGDLSLSRSRYEVLAHLLATLEGVPATRPPPAMPPALVDLPPLPDAGVPAESLRRRPDVEAAWRRVDAADRDLAAAVADRFPRVDLSAAAVLGGAGFQVLFLDRVASLAADLTAPLLDGGRRRAQIDADAATKRERLHLYRDTVLQGLREVEDALAEERRQREFLASLDRQHELAVQVVDTLLNRYGQGASPYLDVLAAVQSEQSLTLALVSAKRRLLELRIELCRALAGSWSPKAACRPACSPSGVKRES